MDGKSIVGESKLSLEEIQERQYNLLCFFADYCEAKELRYCLFGGTLLGAVRHKNFIPWDDDIDVCMPRPDYDRFIEYAANEEWEHYGLESYQSPFIKLVDYRYGFLERLLKDQYREESLFIDIFPVDGVPDVDIDKHFSILDSARRKLVWTICDPKRAEGPTRTKRALLAIVLTLWPISDPKRYLADIDSEARRYSYDDCSSVSCCVWGWGFKDISKKADFEQFVKLPFRNREFFCQGNYEESLRLKYGNYMELPPENERQNEHGVFWIRQTSEKKG